MQKLHLLLIDPQNDFCDPAGSLHVPGADRDMDRLAVMINRLAGKLSDIHVTLDSHRKVDISHPLWWRDAAGNHPAPFSVISAAAVASGEWTTWLPSTRTRSLSYLQELERRGRYPHVIWPEHCLIGDSGHNVFPLISEAIHEWEDARFAMADFVTKGSNPWTEHFSAVQAEVPDAADPSTQVNATLISTLQSADLVLLAGEALSHCLANSVRDIADCFGDPATISKLVLLTDASSPVTGFETQAEAFVREMTARGMKTATTRDILAA